MNKIYAFRSGSIQDRPPSDFDVDLYINISIPDNIFGGSHDTEKEMQTKAIFVEYFKESVPKMFIADKRFYVDYIHDGNKTKQGKISKAGHTSSESKYIVLFAKNPYGFVMNSWIVDLRIGEHTSPKDKDEETNVDIREVARDNYLNDFERFGSNLHIDRETFEQMSKTFKDIYVKCGASFKSNTTVKLPNKSKRCKNVDAALKYIDDYRNELYEEMAKDIDTFFYKGYKIQGSENSCIVMNLHDDVIKSGLTMSSAKEFINTETKDSKQYEVYGAENPQRSFTKQDLANFADEVVDALQEYITDETYYFIWKDIHFEYNFEVLVLDIVDSDGVSYVAEINVDYRKFIGRQKYRDQCVHDFVYQITEVYSEYEIG